MFGPRKVSTEIGERKARSNFVHRSKRSSGIVTLGLALLLFRFVVLDQRESISKTITGEDKNPAFSRVIITYLPVNEEQSKIFAPQLNWLVESWKDMQLHQPEGVRTDILVVTKKMSASFQYSVHEECSTENRAGSTGPGRCIILDGYQPISERDSLFQNYAFADSIDVILHANKKGILKHYDFALRSDLDTFVTPAFASWKPKVMTVGGGSYCYDGHLTCHRLRRIARDMDLAGPKDEPIENVGSTWYGPSSQISECAELTVKVLQHLSLYEFTPWERGWGAGANNWPAWHFGVMLLYAAQIAMNYCARPEVGGFEKRTDMLDFPSSSEESIHDHAHLHTWPSDSTRFSKSVYLEGGYDGVTLTDLDLTVIQDYAYHMAMTANKKSVRR